MRIISFLVTICTLSLPLAGVAALLIPLAFGVALARGRRIERVCFLCLAMIIEQRDTLLREDFAGCIHVLQRYPPEDVQLLLDRSCALWDRVRGGGGAAPAPGVKEKAIANLAQVAEAWASAGKSMAAGAAGAWEALEGAADSAAESVLGLGPGTPR